MIDKDQITAIFVTIDEFCIELSNCLKKNSLGNGPKRKPIMSASEIMTITVLFHLSGIRCFKWFYCRYVSQRLRSEFPDLVSYNRFVELQKKILLPMALFTKMMGQDKCTGISFIDSTPLRVCKNKRIFNHKVFKGIATRGKSTMGFFFGFKIHIIVNDKGDIVDFQITQANVDDRTPLKETLWKNIFGRLYGDKGYVGQELFEMLFNKGIRFTTGIRKNMKNKMMAYYDKLMLRKRSIIETINDQLKNICNVEHSRHRSFHNFINNVLAGMIAYSFLPKKPAVRFDEEFNQEFGGQKINTQICL